MVGEDDEQLSVTGWPGVECVSVRVLARNKRCDGVLWTLCSCAAVAADLQHYPITVTVFSVHSEAYATIQLQLQRQRRFGALLDTPSSTCTVFDTGMSIVCLTWVVGTDSVVHMGVSGRVTCTYGSCIDLCRAKSCNSTLKVGVFPYIKVSLPWYKYLRCFLCSTAAFSYMDSACKLCSGCGGTWYSFYTCRLSCKGHCRCSRTSKGSSMSTCNRRGVADCRKLPYQCRAIDHARFCAAPSCREGHVCKAVEVRAFGGTNG